MVGSLSSSMMSRYLRKQSSNITFFSCHLIGTCSNMLFFDRYFANFLSPMRLIGSSNIDGTQALCIYSVCASQLLFLQRCVVLLFIVIIFEIVPITATIICLISWKCIFSPKSHIDCQEITCQMLLRIRICESLQWSSITMKLWKSWSVIWISIGLVELSC